MIEIADLRREFGELVAVDGLSFKLEVGDTFGFIGPNGAGKTTTMRILATLLPPTGGTVRIGGLDPVSQYRKVREILGYMPDFFGIYDDLKVWEYLDFFARSYRIHQPRRKRLIDEVLSLTDLTAKADAMVDSLSRGVGQRLCLAKTLIHDPQILLLDEPASGLDPRARIEMRELLKELRRMGKTIMVSSHILPELADVCNKVGIIEQGRLVAFGTVDELIRRYQGPRRVRMKVAGDVAAARQAIAAVEGVGEVTLDGDGLVACLSRADADLTDVIRAILDRQVKLVAFEQVESDLEDVFLTATRGVVG